MKSKNMATMASWLLSTFDVHDFFWLGKIKIDHERKSKIKSNNLKTFRDLKVILKEEFKAKVRTILEL